jgi:hypothetical protein
VTRSRLATFALAAAAVLVVAPAGAAIRDRAGQDSPWPRSGELGANVRAVNTVVRQLEAEVELMEQSADRYADWQSCLRGVPVSEYGDQDGRSGYLYDERDGTGPGHMPALAVDRKSRPRREDYLFLDFAGSAACRSHAPRPGGTADAAAARSAAPRRARPATLTGLERRVEALKRSARRLDAASERFDEWESCVSWVPVTEYGDPDGAFGYLFRNRDQSAAYRPALAVDRSDWDDPDYMILALVGGDRPGRGCQDEPGEAVD